MEKESSATNTERFSFLAFIVVVLAILPLILNDNTGGVSVLILFYPFAIGFFFFVPTAAGLWCATSRRSLATRAVVLATAVGAVTASVVGTTVGTIGPTGTLDRKYVEIAVESSTVLFAVALSVWATAKLLLIFVLRREQLTIAKMIVLIVITAVSISWVRTWSGLQVMRGIGWLDAIGIALAAGSCCIAICPLYLRNMGADAGACCAVVAILAMIPIIGAGEPPPVELIGMTLGTTVTFFAMNRFAIEIGVVQWGPKGDRHRYWSGFTVG